MDFVDMPSTAVVLRANPNAIEVVKNTAGDFAGELVGVPMGGVETKEILAL